MKTKDFFDAKADNYATSRATGFLKKHIDKEKNCVLELLDIKEGEHILDAGCGDGYYSVLMKKAGAVPFGIDISEKMITNLKKRGIDGTVSDLETFRTDMRFDKVLCSGALEFLKNHDAALRNFNRHLKNGGGLVVLYPRKSVPGCAYWAYHKSHGINIRLFSARELLQSMHNANFKNVTDIKANALCSVAWAQKSLATEHRL